MSARECPAGYCENEGTDCCYHPIEEPSGEWVEVCCKCEEYKDV